LGCIGCLLQRMASLLLGREAGREKERWMARGKKERLL
jgi:hypothetical protein